MLKLSNSITTNLLVYEETISGALEEGFVIDSIYTDFSKALDRVDHFLLVDKLGKYGVGGTLLNWLFSYLTNRKQILKIKSVKSNVISVTSGVSQGGHLALLLFIMFVNDVIHCYHNSHVLMYADDFKILKSLTRMILRLGCKRTSLDF